MANIKKFLEASNKYIEITKVKKRETIVMRPN